MGDSAHLSFFGKRTREPRIAWAARSLNLWAYSLMDSCSRLVILWSWFRSGVISVLYWYCLMKAVAKSFHDRIWEASRLVYHATAAPAKLSWKKWTNSFSSAEYAPIFRQYIRRCPFGHVVPLYFIKVRYFELGRDDDVGHET